MNEKKLQIAVAGLALAGLLYLADAAYFPLLLVGPPLTGLLVARRAGSAGVAVGVWVAAGLALLVYDGVVNREDMAFHAVVTVVTALTAWAGWAIGRRFRRPAPA